MRELFDSCLPLALDCGIHEWDYWEMTYGEINNAIKAYNRRYEREQKEKALFVYKTADLMRLAVGSMVDKNTAFPAIYDAFPGMFEREKQVVEDKKKESELAVYKAKFARYAEQRNNARRGDKEK